MTENTDLSLDIFSRLAKDSLEKTGAGKISKVWAA
jgi:hypothetical protein